MKPGLPMLHDSNPHIARMIAFHTALLDHQFPPMWAKEILGGIGSPVMMLNYQLPYFATEGIHRIGYSFFDSYKIALGLSLVISGALMFLALSQKYDHVSAILGALIYSLAPYRFLDIYVRGALGESLTFIFPPLLIWGFARSSLPILILGWAGLFLTHPLASAAFSAFYLGYVLWVGKKSLMAARLKMFFISFGIALLLASFNLLPTLALTKLTYYSPELSDTLLMFPSFQQLIHSKWGYGVSLPGTNDGMSFEIGYVQWAMMLAGVFVWLKSKDKELRYLLLAMAVCLFFILPISIPVYKLFSLGKIIDFPWRLILCIVYGSGYVGALCLSKIKSQKIRITIAAVLSTILIVLALPIAHTNMYWHKPISWFARETGDSYGEYAPLTRESRDSSPFWKRAEFVSGQGEIETLIDQSNLQRYRIKAKSNGVVRINTTYFPGWILPANCHVTKRTLTHIDDSGLVGCNVEPGESIVEIKFVAPTVQRVGNLVTLLGIGVYLWILFLSFYPHSMKKTR